MTILVTEACPMQLFFLKALLNSFADSMGLHVNYQKSNIYPINVSDERMDLLDKTFNYNIGTYPFTYLGLPMGTTKPRVNAFLPLIQKLEKRLSTTSLFLSHASRLQMVNSVSTSLPTVYLCTLKIPSSVTFYLCNLKILSSVVKQIDKYRKHCL
jgi:hypothetical protein